VAELSCARLVAPSGHLVDYLAQVSTNDVLSIRCVGPPEHCPVGDLSFEGAGHAHLVADVDNDGMPELIMSGNGAYGDRDRVVVSTQRGASVSRVYDKGFASGIVAMSAGPLRATGPVSVIVAVRSPGAGRATLWTLD
jgi:hypothetical protein